MASSENPFNWQEAIQETAQELTVQVFNYAPQIIGAGAIVLLGWGIAHALAISSHKLVLGLDRMFVRMTRADGENRERIKSSYALIISKAVFWIVMLFSFAVGANILKWNLFSTWFDSLLNYLPGLITGLIILLGGYLLSNLAKSAVITATHKTGVQHSLIMARVIQITIIFSSIIIGVDQIGLNIGFLSNLIVTVIAILLAGAVLAFGLGAREFMANVIGVQHVKRICSKGDYLKIQGVEGEIVDFSQSGIVLETADGMTAVPGKLFHEQIFHNKPGNE